MNLTKYIATTFTGGILATLFLVLFEASNELSFHIAYIGGMLTIISCALVWKWLENEE